MAPVFSVYQRKRILLIRKKAKNAKIAQLELEKEGIFVSVSGMKRIMSRYKIHHTLEDRKRSGRPRKTDKNQDIVLKKKVLRNRKKSLSQLARELSATSGTPISRHLVTRRLKEKGFSRFVAARQPASTEIHRATVLRSLPPTSIKLPSFGIFLNSPMRKFSQQPTTHIGSS